MAKRKNHTSNTGVFHTGISGDTGMTGSTGMAGNSEISDKISMAGTTGSSGNTNGSEYSRNGMNQMGMTAGSDKGPTAGISGSDGSGVYGITDRAGGSSDPSNSSITGGWSLSDVNTSEKGRNKDNSFRDLE